MLATDVLAFLYVDHVQSDRYHIVSLRGYEVILVARALYESIWK